VTSEMEAVLDTIDTGIYLCSNSVLPLFTDNFDCSNLTHFIKNILMNEEIMGNTIYLHQVEKGYASRIVDFDSYRGVR
jgi:translation initiation factor eIF-2B subunit epsilon